MIRLRLAASILGAASLATLAVTGASAANPNLITNGDFTTGIGGWSLRAGVPGSLGWSLSDHSLVIVNNSAPGETTLASAQQCVTAIDDGRSYTLEADAFVASGQQRSGGAHARVFWYAGDSCNGSVLGSPFASTFITAFNTWTHTNDTFTAPAGAKSASILLGVQQNEAGAGEDPAAHFKAKWDNVSFRKNLILLAPPIATIPPLAGIDPPIVKTPPTIVINPPVIKTPLPVKTPPTIVSDPPATTTPGPIKVPPTVIVNPAGTATPSPASTPGGPATTEHQSDEPAAQPAAPVQTPADSTGSGATQPPHAPASLGGNLLPPDTGSDVADGGPASAIPLFSVVAGALALTALAGLVLAVVQVKRRN
ncbi:MAG: hypothetical protein LC118_18295 [Dehalococcoidia bacterium]|nr:hypothetical protein [Dehalococcoidia bacterium]